MSVTDQQLIDFVVREARLLDQQKLDDWLDLFTEDGHYWMPVEWGQSDPRLTTSLMYEDKLLLRIRIERLKGKATYSQKPKSRCHHVLQIPQIDKRDEAGNEYVTWTPMHYVETRLDDGHCRVHVARAGARPRTRCPQRSVLVRWRNLRDGHRNSPVPRR